MRLQQVGSVTVVGPPFLRVHESASWQCFSQCSMCDGELVRLLPGMWRSLCFWRVFSLAAAWLCDARRASPAGAFHAE